MRLEVWIGSYKFQFNAHKYQQITGICSNLEDGKHFLMWDFDNVLETDVIVALTNIQRAFHLPNIYVIKSKESGSYHAYSFARTDWATCQYIIANTTFVDEGFHKIAVMRGYYTLRITPKLRSDNILEGFSHVGVIAGRTAETVNPIEAMRMVRYWTKKN